MENNKYYLKNFPAITLMAALCGLLGLFAHNIIPKSWAGENRVNLLYGFFYLYDTVLFISLGLISRNWVAAILSLFVAYILYTAGLMWVYNGNYSIWIYLFSIFNSLAPLLIFLLLINFQVKKIPVNFVLLLICLKTMFPVFLVQQNGTLDFFLFNLRYGTSWYMAVSFFIFVFPLLLQLLFISETINHNNGKLNWSRPRLVNLGNQYPEAAAIILQVILNLGLVLVLANCYNHAKTTIDFSSYPSALPDSLKLAVKVQHISRSCCYLLFIPLYGWYYRKFMLEFFISRNYTSKLLYWFCSMPVIGVIVFIIAVLVRSEEQKDFHSKSRSLSAFAGSSSSMVFAIMLASLLLRLVFLSYMHSPLLIITGVISLLLLFWMISRPAGYYFNLGLNMLVTAALAFVSYFGNIDHYEEYYPQALLFSLSVISSVSLIMILPIFHISQFEYIPDFPPDNFEEGGDLFPEYNPYPAS